MNLRIICHAEIVDILKRWGKFSVTRDDSLKEYFLRINDS